MMQLFSKTRENRLLAFLIFLLVLLVGVFGCVVFSYKPLWIFNGLGISEATSPKYEALKFLGIGMGGLLIAIQAVIANNRANAMQQAAQAQARATEEQAKANDNSEQGQRQERLKNAIEHLGHLSDSVRMGGAYELFLLARDTENRALRQTVLEILCAHIRKTTGESEYRIKHKSKPSEEAQSLLTLLFVRDHDVFRDLPISLRGTWLNGANLRGARLEKASLSDAWMRGVKLIGANLEEADMAQAHLQGADLTKARMRRAFLNRTRMQGACLNRVRLYQAQLHGAQMQGAKLIAARMQGALLMHAEMQGADLYCAQLQTAILTDVKLQAARLVRAQFQAATLDGVYLGGVTPRGSNAPEARIRERIGMPGILIGTIFQGGMEERNIESILEVEFDEDPSVLRGRLESHLEEPASHELPEGREATTEPYTREEAERWIAEYKEAMSEVPEVE